MVPVGGAVVLAPTKAFVDAVSGCYPGRASMTPILDLFITLLSMGQTGYRRLLEERVRIRADMLMGLRRVCDRHGISLLDAPNNSISTAVSLDGLLLSVKDEACVSDNILDEVGVEVCRQAKQAIKKQQSDRLSFLGSMLFQRCVSGCRVVTCTGEAKKVAGVTFMDWGSHINSYPHSYFTVACSVGVTDGDITLFLERLDKVLAKFKKQYSIVSASKVTDEGDLVLERSK